MVEDTRSPATVAMDEFLLRNSGKDVNTRAQGRPEKDDPQGVKTMEYRMDDVFVGSLLSMPPYLVLMMSSQACRDHCKAKGLTWETMDAELKHKLIVHGAGALRDFGLDKFGKYINLVMFLLLYASFIIPLVTEMTKYAKANADRDGAGVEGDNNRKKRGGEDASDKGTDTAGAEAGGSAGLSGELPLAETGAGRKEGGLPAKSAPSGKRRKGRKA